MTAPMTNTRVAVSEASGIERARQRRAAKDASGALYVDSSIYEGMEACLVRNGRTVAHVVKYADAVAIAEAHRLANQSPGDWDAEGFLSAIHERTPTGGWIAVQHCPDGSWSVAHHPLPWLPGGQVAAPAALTTQADDGKQFAENAKTSSTTASGGAEREVETTRLMYVIDRDRYIVAIGLEAIRKAIGGHTWLLEGRGPYAWDDDDYRREFGAAITNVETALEPLARIAADKSDCTTDSIKVQEARDAARQYLAALAQPDTEADGRV